MRDIKLRLPGEHKNPRRYTDDDREAIRQEVLALQLKGYNGKQLSKYIQTKYSMQPVTAYQWLKRWDIKIERNPKNGEKLDE